MNDAIIREYTFSTTYQLYKVLILFVLSFIFVKFFLGDVSNENVVKILAFYILSYMFMERFYPSIRIENVKNIENIKSV
jgi:hypothetical protein